jgi:hypothetical protein
MSDGKPIGSADIGDGNTFDEHTALIQPRQVLVTVAAVRKGLHEVAILSRVQGKRSTLIKNKYILSLTELEEVCNPGLSQAGAKDLQVPFAVEARVEARKTDFNPMLFEDGVEQIGRNGRL